MMMVVIKLYHPSLLGSDEFQTAAEAEYGEDGGGMTE